MSNTSTKNASSADNQQETSTMSKDPQRLYAKYPNKQNTLTHKEATLLGILYTDGCLSKKGKRSWRFFLGNTSYEIIHAFKESMLGIFNLKEERVRIYEKIVNNKPYYKAVVDSKDCGQYLTDKYGTFRTLAYKDSKGNKTYPTTKLPFSENTSTSILSTFLKTAFSCDGGINLYPAKSKQGYRFLIRNAYIACHHPQLQIDYQNLLKILNVNSKIILNDNKVLIQGRVDLERFKQKVGFLNGVNITQHSIYWNGWEKNKVLQMALNSYGKPSEILKMCQKKDNDIVRTSMATWRIKH